MAFGNIATFYFPTAANAGASQWGSDVRKMLDSADAASDATTVTSHGTGTGQTRRTFDPYTTSTADLTEADYGWAPTPADMNSVVGALRYVRAGDHVLTLRTLSSSVTGSGSLPIFAFIYRVAASPAFTRTLIDSVQVSVTSPGASPGTVTITVPGVPEIALAAGETIQYSIERIASGVAIIGHTITWYMGTQGGVAIRVDFPGLATVYDEAHAVVGVGVATLGRRTVGKALSVSAVGVAAIQRYVRLAEKTATASGIASIAKYFRIAAPFSVAGVGVASEDNYIKPTPFVVVGVGVASTLKYVRLAAKTAIAVGVAAFSKFVEAFRHSSVVAVGVAGFARAFIGVRVFVVVGVGIAGLFVKISQAIVNRMTGGGTTTIIHPYPMIDD